MSWFINPPVDSVISDLPNALSTVTVDYFGEDSKPYVDDQLEAAKQAAIAIANSGVVGSNTHSVRVTLSGHGNEGHVPVEGWANDCVTVSVSQV